MKKSEFIQPHFKIQTQPKKKNDGSYSNGICVWYINSRDCQDYLDREYWQECRQNKFYEVKGKTFCSIGININWERVRKSDSGSLSNDGYVDKNVSSKWDSSDAFKRACVMRGIGRYLYSLPTLWISQDEYTKNKYKINEFVRSKYKNELKKWYKWLFKDA